MNELLVQSDGTETAKGIRIRTRLNWEIPGTCDAKPKISNENCTNCLAHRTTHFFRRYYHRWIEYFDRRAESYAWLPHRRADLADLKTGACESYAKNAMVLSADWRPLCRWRLVL